MIWSKSHLRQGITLSGGKDFLPKFADKNKLIALNRKMEKGEDLTLEELECITLDII